MVGKLLRPRRRDGRRRLADLAKSLSLYLGELMQLDCRADVLGDDYLQGNLYVCHWPAGVLYLAAVAAAAPPAEGPRRAALLAVFFVEFSVFLLLPAARCSSPSGGRRCRLIPAVVCRRVPRWTRASASGCSPRRRRAGGLSGRPIEILVLRRGGQPEPRVTVGGLRG